MSDVAPQINVDGGTEAGVVLVGVHSCLLHRVTPLGPMAATPLGRKT
jgi:hypothetical protein